MHKLLNKKIVMLREGDEAFGRYLLKKQIGGGSFSRVYEAYDKKERKLICVKLELRKDPSLQPALCPHEFKILEPIKCQYILHPIKLLSNYVYTGLVMPLLGPSLFYVRRQRETSPTLNMIKHIAANCFRALATLHEVGIVHSDIKPSNIVFKNDGNNYSAVLIDFGLSYLPGEPSEITHYRSTFTRNPKYLSVRVHQTGRWDAIDDMISLIYALSEFWSGSLPWSKITDPTHVCAIKQKTDLASLLPEDISFLADVLDESTSDIADELETLVDWNTSQSEMQYLFENPADV